MAVFDQRAELNRQKRHMAAEWDDDFMLKALGFNEKGERNLWGRMVYSFAPGLNAATHGIAKSRAGGDTKNVLDDTFDEAVYKDFSGLAFGTQIAKSIVGGGGMGVSGGGAGAAGGAGGSGMMSMFGGGGGGMMSMFGGGAGATSGAGAAGGATTSVGSAGGAASTASGDASSAAGSQGGGFGNFMRNMTKGSTGDEMSQLQLDAEAESLQNPYEVGSPEYDAFEREKEKRQKEANKGAFGKGVQRWLQDIKGGNPIESGVNYANSIIAAEKAEQQAVDDYQRGKFAFNPTFNYL